MSDGGQEQKRHWLQSIFNGQQKLGNKSVESEPDEENPWFALQDKEPPSHLRTPGSVTHTPVRWMTDESSPYGFSDDDGTLKQVDNPVWRRAFGNTKTAKGKFVPRESSSTRWQASTAANGMKMDRRGSTWLMQTVAAVVLVAGGVYAHYVQTPVATEVGGVYDSAFSKDDATQLWPSVDAFLTNHHIPVPSGLQINDAIRFHVPVNGSIITGYSANHPSLTYSAAAGAKVFAAGNGTVTKVESDSAGVIVIDHGSSGETIYSNVASVAVKKGEFVSAGQVIGHLKSQGKPTLNFAFEQNGQAVNPAKHVRDSQGGV